MFQTGALLSNPTDYAANFGHTADSISKSIPFDKIHINGTYIEFENDDPQIIEMAKTVTAPFDTPLEKSKAIHDWVASNIKYDFPSYYAGTMAKEDASTVFRNRIGVCEGYSNLTVAMHAAVGISARMVSGEVSEGMSTKGANAANPDFGKCTNSNFAHAWNEVLIGDRWITVDTTWDAGETPLHTYFDPDPLEFAKTHTKCQLFPGLL